MKKRKDLVSYIFIIVGALMASFSVALILLPNDAIDHHTGSGRDYKRHKGQT